MDAEFGHSAGGTMSVSMKSGTNQIHGTGYYFGRNPALNAVVNPITRTPNFVRNHIWGGTAGGPIKKNKLFTFVAYEGWRTKEPRDAVRTMPTDLERTGDFSKSLTSIGTAADYLRPRHYGAECRHEHGLTRCRFRITSSPAAGSTRRPSVSCRISGVRITRAMTFRGSNNFKASYRLADEGCEFLESHRLEHQRQAKSVRQIFAIQDDAGPGTTTRPTIRRAVPNDNGGIMNSRNMAGDLVYTLSPSTVLNFRGSYSMLEDDYSAPDYAVGEEGLAEFWPNNPWYKPYVKDMPLIYYPNIIINGQTSSSYGKGSYWFQHPHHYSFSGKISQQRGSHYLKAGAEYRYHVGIGIFPNLMNFNFYPDSTASTYLSPNTALSGDAHASFLLGVVDKRSAAPILAGVSRQK